MRPARAVISFVGSIPSGHREAVEECLMGGFSPDDVARLWDPVAEAWLPLSWIERWQQELGTPARGGVVVGVPTEWPDQLLPCVLPSG